MDNAALAELLMGIARAQNAVVEAIVRQQGSPALRGQHVIPALQALTGVNQQQAITLGTLPGRVLLQLQGGVDQNRVREWVREELDRLSPPSS